MRDVESKSVVHFMHDVMKEVYEKHDIKLEICCSESAIESNNSNYYIDSTSSIAYLYELYSILSSLKNGHHNPAVLYDAFAPFAHSETHKLFLLF